MKYVKIRNSYFHTIVLKFSQNYLIHIVTNVNNCMLFECMDECVKMISACIVYKRGFLLPASSFCIFHTLINVKLFKNQK